MASKAKVYSAGAESHDVNPKLKRQLKINLRNRAYIFPWGIGPRSQCILRLSDIFKLLNGRGDRM